MFMGLCALLFCTSCGSHKEEEKGEETKFLVTSALQKDTVITRKYVCQIHAISHIELRAMERGYLEHIFVDEGQFMRKGTRMFQILPMLYKAELQKVQAEANLAEIKYKTTKALADSNVVSPNELAMAKAEFDKVNAELSLAQVHLGFTEIRAPFDGIMDHFQVRLGSLVEEGDLLTTLSDNSKMWVYFNVPEAEYLEYKAAAKKDSLMRVGLLMANNKMFPQTGIVETIEADFNNETGNIAFRATFNNPQALLRHGETGSVIVTAPLKDAIIVPQKATFEILEKKYMFTVDKDNKVHQQEITIVGELPDIYIVKGLAPGQKILLEGLRKVVDGDKINFEFEDPNKVIKELRVYAE